VPSEGREATDEEITSGPCVTAGRTEGNDVGRIETGRRGVGRQLYVLGGDVGGAAGAATLCQNQQNASTCAVGVRFCRYREF
jgi:hypothetical protein